MRPTRVGQALGNAECGNGKGAIGDLRFPNLKGAGDEDPSFAKAPEGRRGRTGERMTKLSFLFQDGFIFEWLIGREQTTVYKLIYENPKHDRDGARRGSADGLHVRKR